MKGREVPAEPVAAVEDASYGASVVEIRLQSHNLFELLHHGIIRHDDPYQWGEPLSVEISEHVVIV
jgi:hypothetical protein